MLLQLTYTREKLTKDVIEHLNCKESMNKNIDTCLRQQFDSSFHQRFGCYYPMFTAQNETSNLCNIADLNEDEQKQFYNLFNGTLTAGKHRTSMKRNSK